MPAGSWRLRKGLWMPATIITALKICLLKIVKQNGTHQTAYASFSSLHFTKNVWQPLVQTFLHQCVVMTYSARKQQIQSSITKERYFD
jgi:hypothetical protein